jgi:hypothetical protein
MGFPMAVYRSTSVDREAREGCRGLCDVEALPEARQNNVTVAMRYQHGGWITQHIVRMDPAFMQTETTLADLVSNLDPWSGVVPEALVLIVRQFAPSSRR